MILQKKNEYIVVHLITANRLIMSTDNNINIYPQYGRLTADHAHESMDKNKKWFRNALIESRETLSPVVGWLSVGLVCLGICSLVVALTTIPPRYGYHVRF